MTDDRRPSGPDPRPPGEAGHPPDPEQLAKTDRYRQIYESVALPVLVIDHETWLVVDANEAAMRLYGYSREEFVGLPVLRVRPPEGRSEARAVLSEMPHGFWKTSAVKHQRKDGSVFSADVWSRDTVVDGRSVRIATVSDVTERVELQHELLQAQKLEAVGRLAGGIAHDFNNGLTAIIAGVDFLSERLDEGDDGVLAEELDGIRRAAERAASLTRQLLAYSRQQMMSVAVVPLNDVVEEAETLLRRILGAHIELRCDLDGATPPVRVDPVQLEQVILNLAVNAQDAMPSGGTLELTTRNVSSEHDLTVSGQTIPVGEYAELAVRDTGAGMDEATATRIFEPFFTTKPPPEGTGLGLSTAYGIIRQSDGYITVESAVGEGTTFRIYLPRAHTRRSGSPAAVAPDTRTSRTVLVVEDEDAVRRVVRKVLERLGHTVLTAADGDEAVALIEPEEHSIDLLVTDLVMPGRSGREVAVEFSAIYPGRPVLYMSGYTTDAAGDLGLLDEGRAFLQKPFSIEALSGAVRDLLGGSEDA